MQKPTRIEHAGYFLLGGGAVALLTGVGVALLSGCLWIPWIYSMGLGVMSIIWGAQLLNRKTPGMGASMPRALAVMLIINLITCDLVGAVMGILALSALNAPESQAWLNHGHLPGAGAQPPLPQQRAPAPGQDEWADVQGGWDESASQEEAPAPHQVGRNKP